MQRSVDLGFVGGPKYVGVSNPETHLKVRLPLPKKNNIVSIKPAIKDIEGDRQVGRRRKIVGYRRREVRRLIAGGNAKGSLRGDVERASGSVILDNNCDLRVSSHRYVISQWCSAAIQSYRDDLDVSSLCQLHRVLGYFGTRFGGIGGYLSSSGVSCSDPGLANRKMKPTPHVLRLPIHSPKLSTSEKNESASQANNPPIRRRLLAALGLMALGFAIDEGGSRRIRSLWPIAFCGFVISMSLFVLGGFTWSWGWWF